MYFFLPGMGGSPAYGHQEKRILTIFSGNTPVGRIPPKKRKQTVAISFLGFIRIPMGGVLSRYRHILLMFQD
jgi:hypothetical protein